MKRLKLNLFSKVILFSLILIGVGYLFFKNSFNPSTPNENSPPEISILDFQNKVFDSAQKSDAKKTSLGDTSAWDEKNKLQTAIKNINRKPRLPSGQMKPDKSELSDSPLETNSRWKIWKNVKAIKSDVKPNDEQLIGEMNHFYIVQDNSINAEDFSSFDREQPVVVYNERLHKPGLLTGIIKVETADRIQLENDLVAQQAQIFDAFDSIQTYFVSATHPQFNLEALFNNLKSRPYIKKIEFEIIGTTYEKN